MNFRKERKKNEEFVSDRKSIFVNDKSAEIRQFVDGKIRNIVKIPVPLFLLVLERIAHNRFGKITQDQMLIPKLIAISLIVLGVVLLVILSG